MNNSRKDLIHIVDNDHIDIQRQLMSLPQPTLDDKARERILAQVHNAMPVQPEQQETIEATSRILQFKYPAQSALRLAASVAIFVVMLYQFGIPAIQDDTSIETVYPIQRSTEMQDVDLIAVYFS